MHYYINKQDYIQKLEGMLDESIKRGTYDQSTDNTRQDWETFQSFLYHNFKNHTSYDKMRTKSNQPASRTGKANKFNDHDEITVAAIKI